MHNISCGAFIAIGLMKLTTPIAELSATVPWAADFPVAMVRTMGAVDLPGSIGILLPALTRILPCLTVLATLGCVALQISAIIFHASRGEFIVLPMKLIFLSLSAFVLWGQSK